MTDQDQRLSIVLESRAFFPSIGGIERMGAVLREEWSRLGHEVTIVTQTALGDHAEVEGGGRVVRRPRVLTLRHVLESADVFVQNGLSLRSLPLALRIRVPTLVIHQATLGPHRSHVWRERWLARLKQQATRLVENVAISGAVEVGVRGPCTIIPNAIAASFLEAVAVSRPRSGILFAGRLVTDKGADVALRALKLLGPADRLTLIGDGPERSSLERLASSLGLLSRVAFLGWASPLELRDHMCRAEVVVVPSRYEPFGIVAIEAIACGAEVVATNVDGLPEAVGRCGRLVAPDDPLALALAIGAARHQDNRTCPAARAQHVARHRGDSIAAHYVEVIRRIVDRGGGG